MYILEQFDRKLQISGQVPQGSIMEPDLLSRRDISIKLLSYNIL